MSQLGREGDTIALLVQCFTGSSGRSRQRATHTPHTTPAQQSVGMSAAAVAAATAVGPLDAAGASAAVAAPAPAAARQWSRDVQRAVRVAVTGVRTVRSVYSAESERGYAVLNQVCVCVCVCVCMCPCVLSSDHVQAAHCA